MKTANKYGQSKEKCVRVVGKNGKALPSCTKKRAAQLISRECAKWIGFNVIELIIDSDDRKRLRREIVEEAGRVCYICDEYIPKDEPATLDHLVTRSRGGRDTKENLRCSCKRCNDDRGDMTLVQYVRHIRLRREYYNYITDDKLMYLEELGLYVEG